MATKPVNDGLSPTVHFRFGIFFILLGTLVAVRAVVRFAATDPRHSPVPSNPSAFVQAEPAPDLQQLFKLPQHGGPSGTTRLWLGADCGTSLALPGNRALWLFGDTFLSTWSDGRRDLSGCAMPHQTVAFQEGSGPLSYVWREAGASNSPTNLFWPNGSQHDAVECSSPFVEVTPYYWVVAGIESSAAGLAAGKLLLLAQRIIGTPGQGLGFAVVGTTLLVVDTDLDPREWPNAHSVADLTTCSPSSHGQSTCETWSAGVFAARDCGVGCVYLVGGTGSAAAGYGQALLRGNLTELLALDFGALELLCADGSWRPHVPGASPNGCAGVPPAQGSVDGTHSLFPQQSEITLLFVPSLNRWITIFFNGFAGQRLLLWASDGSDVRGPWSSTEVYTLTPPWSNTSLYFCYATKLHPQLARSDDEAVLTYVANAWSMPGLFTVAEDRIYTPQVLRIASLSAVLRSSTT